MKYLHLLFFFLGMGMVACSSSDKGGDSDKILYQHDVFTISADQVTQGKFVAKVESDKRMTSNYLSPTMEAYSRKVEFKFSLNRKDNELPYGKNHSITIYPKDGVFETPVIKFGEQVQGEEPKDGDYLEKNTKVTIRLDMGEVINSFEQKGFYEDIHGEKIAKEDFQGVFIAGGSAPLNWDFDNLGGDQELKDEDGDGIYEAIYTMNVYDKEAYTASVWELENDISAYPQYTTDFPLLNTLYNLTLDEVVKLKEADGTFRTGKKWDGVWTRDVSYAIVLGMGAAEPEVSKTSLRKKVKRDRIIQDTGSGGAYPVSTDRTTWSLAAWELYCITGDKEWLKEAYQIIKNTVDDDLQVIVCEDDGLAKGESSFLDWRKQEYPRWMDNVAISQSECLGTNAVHYATWNILSKMADILGEPSDMYKQQAKKLKQSINKELWLEKEGYYAMYKYGMHDKFLLPRAEALGEALTVLYDIAPKNRQQKIVANTPNLAYGTPCFYPQISGIRPYHNNGIWPFVQAFYNLAAAKVGNGKALEHGLAGVYRASALFLTNKENMVAQDGDYATELNSDYQLWSVGGHLGMVYKVFFGMDFQPDYLVFKPVIPSVYTGTKTLKNFKYRNAILNIEVKGTGSQITSFKLDGKVQPQHRVDGNLTGEHQIEIVLAGNDIKQGASFTLVANQFDLGVPDVVYSKGKLEWKAVDGATGYMVYKNGEMEKEVTETTFPVTETKTFTAYTVIAKNQQGLQSLISEPVIVTSSKAMVMVEAEKATKPTSQKIANYTGKGAVKLTRDKNKKLKWTVNIPSAGAYYIDIQYANGSGPWNTDNKCATRTLGVNGEKKGIFVMAQRGTDEWSSWAYTNPIVANLKKGRNELTLTFESYNENMNVEVNTALIDHIRLIKKW